MNMLEQKYFKTDSTYILTNSDLESLVEKRFFYQADSGFMIRDFKGSILTQEGGSKLIFPIIIFGYCIVSIIIQDTIMRVCIGIIK